MVKSKDVSNCDNAMEERVARDLQPFTFISQPNALEYTKLRS